jgi:hypothetical protein
MTRCQHRESSGCQCVRVENHNGRHEPNIPGFGEVCRSIGPGTEGTSDSLIPGGFYPHCRRLEGHQGVHAWWQSREISLEWRNIKMRPGPPTRMESAEFEIIEAAIQMVHKGRLPSVPGQPGWSDGIARLSEAVDRYQQIQAELEEYESG